MKGLKNEESTHHRSIDSGNGNPGAGRLGRMKGLIGD
jgi:hypothetical protein